MQDEPAAHRQALVALGQLIREARAGRSVDRIVDLASLASPSVPCSTDWYRSLEAGTRVRGIAPYELRAVCRGLVTGEAEQRALYAKMADLVFPRW